MRREATVLVVEDSADDFTFLARATRKLGFPGRLWQCANADEAQRYLLQQRPYEAAPRPSLILMDLNLPGMDGRELLRSLKADERWKSIPIVILTTSMNPVDIEFCYKHHANSYHQKPMALDDLTALIQVVFDYWLHHAAAPLLPRGAL